MAAAPGGGRGRLEVKGNKKRGRPHRSDEKEQRLRLSYGSHGTYRTYGTHRTTGDAAWRGTAFARRPFVVFSERAAGGRPHPLQGGRSWRRFLAAPAPARVGRK